MSAYTHTHMHALTHTHRLSQKIWRKTDHAQTWLPLGRWVCSWGAKRTRLSSQSGRCWVPAWSPWHTPSTCGSTGRFLPACREECTWGCEWMNDYINLMIKKKALNTTQHSIHVLKCKDENVIKPKTCFHCGAVVLYNTPQNNSKTRQRT